MSEFSVIKTSGSYSYLTGVQVIVIGRVADSKLLRVELPGGKQIDLLDSEVLSHHEFHNDYEQRVRDLEAEGCTRSDAQAIVDAQQL